MTTCDNRKTLQLITEVSDVPDVTEFGNAYLWNESTQSLAAGDKVTFENEDIFNSLVTHNAGEITFNEDGRYLVEYYVAVLGDGDTKDGMVSFVATIDSTALTQTQFSSYIASTPSLDFVYGQFIYTATAGDVMAITNASVNKDGSISITVPDAVGGDSLPVGVNASVVIMKLNS
jgi:hypothetical protein